MVIPAGAKGGAFSSKVTLFAHDKYEWMALTTRDMTHVAVSRLLEEV